MLKNEKWSPPVQNEPGLPRLLRAPAFGVRGGGLGTTAVRILWQQSSWQAFGLKYSGEEDES